MEERSGSFLPELPYTNRGVIRQKEELSALIDWCQITIKEVPLEAVIEDVLRIPMELMTVTGYEKGIAGHEVVAIFDNIKVLKPTGNAQYQGFQILMSGKGCRNYENFLQLNEETWFDFLNRVCQYHINFPRIDLAIDDRKPYLSIRNLDIQRVINDMNKQGRASSSMRDALGRVRECLESAKNNRIIDINPCFEINVPWENKTAERRFLSMAEQTRFLQEVEHNWYKEMFYIMFLTGMRIGEVGGLKWEDIDWNKKCINIQRSLSCQYENGVKTMRLTKPKTHNSYRSIPFMAETEEILLSQKEKQNRQKKAYGNRWRSSGEFDNLVFTTSLGSPVIRNVAEKEIKKVVKAINFQEAIEAVKENREPIEFKDLYPHAIRHTFCSRCFEKGMDAKVVQMLMGHQHYSTTIDIYTHVTETKFEEEIAKFGNVSEKQKVQKNKNSTQCA